MFNTKQSKKKTKIILSLIGALIVLRLFLPLIMKKSINWYLATKVENYYGSIDDFDLALWRGSYSMQGLVLYDKSKHVSVPPILTIADLDISIAWRALFKGRFLIDLSGKEVNLNLADSKDEKKAQLKGHPKDASEILNTLVPFKIEQILLSDSRIKFTNTDLKIPATFELKEINGKVQNIYNIQESTKELPSSVKISAKIQNSGKLMIKSTFDLFQKPQALDLDVKMEKLNLTELNAILMAYGPLSFTSGTLSIYTEMATREGKIKGYIKPFLTNLDVVAPYEAFKSFKHFGFEMISAAGNLILRTSKDKTVATKIEIEGTTKQPDYSMWDAFWIAVEHAFSKTLKPNLENKIEIEDVK